MTVARGIDQTNLYFPRTVSAIGLPDLQPQNAEVAKLKNEIALARAPRPHPRFDERPNQRLTARLIIRPLTQPWPITWAGDPGLRWLSLWRLAVGGGMPASALLPRGVPSSDVLRTTLGVRKQTLLAVLHRLASEGLIHRAGREGWVGTPPDPVPEAIPRNGNRPVE